MNSNFPSYSRTKCASNLDYYYSMCTSAIILLLDMFSLSIAIVDKPQWNYWIARCRHRCFFSILLTHSSWKSTKMSHFFNTYRLKLFTKKGLIFGAKIQIRILTQNSKIEKWDFLVVFAHCAFYAHFSNLFYSATFLFCFLISL